MSVFSHIIVIISYQNYIFLTWWDTFLLKYCNYTVINKFTETKSSWQICHYRYVIFKPLKFSWWASEGKALGSVNTYTFRILQLQMELNVWIKAVKWVFSLVLTNSKFKFVTYLYTFIENTSIQAHSQCDQIKCSKVNIKTACCKKACHDQVLLPAADILIYGLLPPSSSAAPYLSDYFC